MPNPRHRFLQWLPTLPPTSSSPHLPTPYPRPGRHGVGHGAGQVLPDFLNGATRSKGCGKYHAGPTDSAESPLTVDDLVARAHANRQGIR